MRLGVDWPLVFVFLLLALFAAAGLHADASDKSHLGRAVNAVHRIMRPIDFLGLVPLAHIYGSGSAPSFPTIVPMRGSFLAASEADQLLERIWASLDSEIIRRNTGELGLPSPFGDEEDARSSGTPQGTKKQLPTCTPPYVPSVSSASKCTLAWRYDSLQHYLRTGGVAERSESPEALAARAARFPLDFRAEGFRALQKELLAHPALIKAMRERLPTTERGEGNLKVILRPANVHVELLPPGCEVPAETEAPSVPGIPDHALQGWIRSVMKHSGVFSRYFAPTYSGALYFRLGRADQSHYSWNLTVYDQGLQGEVCQKGGMGGGCS